MARPSAADCMCVRTGASVAGRGRVVGQVVAAEKSQAAAAAAAVAAAQAAAASARPRALHAKCCCSCKHAWASAKSHSNHQAAQNSRPAPAHAAAPEVPTLPHPRCAPGAHRRMLACCRGQRGGAPVPPQRPLSVHTTAPQLIQKNILCMAPQGSAGKQSLRATLPD